MVGWGIFLIILGAGSLLLPMFNIQFTLMELFDDYQPYAGIVVAVIGAALVVLAMNRQPDRAAVETQPAARPAGAGTPPARDDADRRP
jgi:hypothetical protein